ncbi:hypothetical protein [Actinosynnema sp. NPDC020468]|uniref:hypothetical protein n=1 Tax=Actinosynnema sp. NPDC020468 TaxID=3154488 RepID=UPI0033F19D76
MSNVPRAVTTYRVRGCGVEQVFLAAAGVVAVVGITILLMSSDRDQRRRAELAAFAAERGWRAGSAGRWRERLPTGDAGNQVKLQYDGTWRGLPVSVAEYRFFQDDPEEGRITHHLAVFVVHLAGAHPRITVRAKGVLSRRRSGDHVVGDERFDRHFLVRTDSPELAARVLTPALVDAHVRGEVPPWSLAGGHLVAHWPGRVRVEAVPDRLDALLTVAELLGG